MSCEKNININVESVILPAIFCLSEEAKGRIKAVVSRGGRPDLVGDELVKVQTLTLLIVAESDLPVISLNQEALMLLCCPKQLYTIEDASHLFEEPGALEEVARLSTRWFMEYL